MTPPTRLTRKAMATTSEVLKWLASGGQDPDMKAQLDASRALVEILLEVG